MKLPSYDGVTEGYELKSVLCPTEQWGVWDGILGSSMNPVAGNFAEINVTKKLNLTAQTIKWWNTTTTNYAYLTDADSGFNFRWRRRPRARSWVENNREQMRYAISARFAHGITNFRATIGVNA
jgi:hypothetical protein